jgi:Protein of unknown function (DUF3152)
MTFASRSATRRPPGALRRFARSYGWRAYAIPVLAVATVLAAIDIVRDHTGTLHPTAQAAAAVRFDPALVPQSRNTGIYVDSPPSGELTAGQPETALPPGGPYSRSGGGRFDVVPGTSRVYGQGGPVLRYTVEVEAGVAEDGPAFATAVEHILGDQRSWGGGARMSFQRVDSGSVDFRVSLASAMTVRKLCGYTLPFETSCYNGDVGRAVINDARWVRGAVAYAGLGLTAYRSYVINHEVGHALGHGHVPCPRSGAAAPVMMQQTLGLSTPGVGACRANPWPYP